MAQGFRINIQPQFCVVAACMMFLVPLPWLLAWVAAALIHEFFHCLALGICRKRIYGVSIGFGCAKIKTGELTCGQTVICALAGPVGGLFMVLFSDVFPYFTICALLQSIYNLLPIYPLDGGRALYGITHLLFSDSKADTVCKVIGLNAVVSVFSFGIYAGVAWKLGCLPVVLAVIFLLHMRKLKIPCK